jgi:hypothetical protein
VLGGPGTSGRAALLAAVNPPCGDRMRDIVATIQADQDEIIRLDRWWPPGWPLRRGRGHLCCRGANIAEAEAEEVR